MNANDHVSKQESSVVTADERQWSVSGVQTGREVAEGELPLYAECDGNAPSAWALEPPEGRHSFRLLVHCRRAKRVPSPSSWSGHFSAFLYSVLSLVAFWHARPRTRYQERSTEVRAADLEKSPSSLRSRT